MRTKMLSAGESLNKPPSDLKQLALSFLATFFTCHLPEQQSSYRFRRLLLMQFSSSWAPSPLRSPFQSRQLELVALALSSLILP